MKKANKAENMAATDILRRKILLKNAIDIQSTYISTMSNERRGMKQSLILTGCPKLAQKYYKAWRHDKVAQIIHWMLYKKIACERYGILLCRLTRNLTATDRIIFAIG